MLKQRIIELAGNLTIEEIKELAMTTFAGESVTWDGSTFIDCNGLREDIGPADIAEVAFEPFENLKESEAEEEEEMPEAEAEAPRSMGGRLLREDGPRTDFGEQELT